MLAVINAVKVGNKEATTAVATSTRHSLQKFKASNRR